MEIGGSRLDDEDLFLYYGEDADTFDTNSDSGSSWIPLFQNGEFNTTFLEITSKSSSVQLVFSSLSADVNFSVSVYIVKFQGNNTNTLIF